DGPVIDDGGVGVLRRDVELHGPGHEVRVGDVGGGGEDRVDVDLRALAEDDAGAVDQDDVAIGAQRAADDRGVGPGHPVERDGVLVRLNELGGLALGDGEALPVDGGPLARLGDGDG